MGILSNLRRSRIQKRFPIADELWNRTISSRPSFYRLGDGDSERLRGMVSVFMREKIFEDAEGATTDEATKVSIAACACLPALNLGPDWLANWNTVVVVPGPFTEDHHRRDRAGVMHEWSQSNIGETWSIGPIVVAQSHISWSERDPARNVVIHEVAHKIDQLDGEMNGRPPLHREMDRREWIEVFDSALEELQRGGRIVRFRYIDPYAATSPEELFAVSSEYFFETPLRLARGLPEVFRLLSQLYRRNPLDGGAPDQPAIQTV